MFIMLHIAGWPNVALHSQPMIAVLFQSSQCELLCNRDVGVALYVTFCWTAWLPVTTALLDSSCSAHTAVDWYSMCREVAELVMSHEVADRPLGGEGREVEVNECHLTRRKYHRGRRTKTGRRVCILGLYERSTARV